MVLFSVFIENGDYFVILILVLVKGLLQIMVPRKNTFAKLRCLCLGFFCFDSVDPMLPIHIRCDIGRTISA